MDLDCAANGVGRGCEPGEEPVALGADLGPAVRLVATVQQSPMTAADAAPLLVTDQLGQPGGVDDVDEHDHHMAPGAWWEGARAISGWHRPVGGRVGVSLAPDVGRHCVHAQSDPPTRGREERPEEAVPGKGPRPDEKAIGEPVGRGVNPEPSVLPNAPAAVARGRRPSTVEIPHQRGELADGAGPDRSVESPLHLGQSEVRAGDAQEFHRPFPILVGDRAIEGLVGHVHQYLAPA